MKKAKKETIITEWFRVFVYGTLKRGFANNYLFKDMEAHFVCEATIKDATIFMGAYRVPYIADAPGEHVNGELWEVPASWEKRLDQFERAYTPRIVETTEGVKCRAYFAPDGQTPYVRYSDTPIKVGSDYTIDHQSGKLAEGVN